MAPKKKKSRNFNGVDMTEIFLGNGKTFGVVDTINHKGISIEALLNAGKKVFRRGAEKPPVKEEEIIDHIKSEKQAEKEVAAKNHNKELKAILEKRRDEERKNRAEMKKELQRVSEPHIRPVSRGRD